MLDTRQMPDISDLGAKCRSALDIAEMLEYSAFNMTGDYSELTAPQRIDFDRMQTAISYCVDLIREITAIASVLDGYEEPQKYGFPAPLPITPEQTAAENERRAKALHEQIDRLLFRAECIAAYQQEQKEKAAPKAGDSQ